MMPEPLDPEAAEVLECLDEMRCGGCEGLGVVVDAAPVAGGLWLICWRTEHAVDCPGILVPEVAYTVDIAALARGDFDLPAAPARPPWRCEATAATTGRRCRARPGPDGLCPAHRRRP
jgi:hypothetical protein